MKDVMYKFENGAYSLNPNHGATPVDRRTDAEKTADQVWLDKFLFKLRSNGNTKVATPERKKVYWRLDAEWYDAKGTRQILKKYICAPDANNPGHYKWDSYSYAAIAKTKLYGDCLVQLKDGPHTVKECVLELYPKLQQSIMCYTNTDPDKAAALIARAVAFKKKIDTVLDINSRRYAHKVEQELYTPEKRVAMVNNEIPDDDRVIACFPVEDAYYNGERTEIQCGRAQVLYYDYSAGIPQMVKSTTDEFIINTNADVVLGRMLCHPSYKELYAMVQKCKTFGITPRLVEGFYHIESYDTLKATDTVMIRKPKGIFGYCITVSAYRELQNVLNWYEGNADLLNDYSDIITIHHEDGIHHMEVSEYEYRSNPDKYADWRETECIDFQAALNKGEDGREEV